MNCLRRRSGRGFTLVEVLVILILGVLCMTGLIYIFRQSRVSVMTAQDKISVLHQGRMLLEYLKRDLRCSWRDPENKDSFPVTTESTVRFMRTASDSAAGPDARRVSYRFDSDRNQVVREMEGAGELVFGSEDARITAFEIKEIVARVGPREHTYFRIIASLEDRDKNPRNKLTLDEKVFPPPMEYYKGLRWVP